MVLEAPVSLQSVASVAALNLLTDICNKSATGVWRDVALPLGKYAASLREAPSTACAAGFDAVIDCSTEERRDVGGGHEGGMCVFRTHLHPAEIISKNDAKVNDALVFLAEEILIQLLEFDRPVRSHADIVFDHKIGQALAVEQDDALVQVLGVVCGLRSGRSSGRKSK